MDYGKYLTNEILAHWNEVEKLDTVFGGVFTDYDPDGKVAGTDKDIWYQGREIWTYAMTYRLVEQRPEYLQLCECAYQFLKKCTAPDGRLPYIVTRDGSPKVAREVYYSEMFAAMGCAQYYRVCLREDVWELAMLYFSCLYELYKKNRTTTQVIDGEPARKCLGLHMAMLATVQFLRNVGRNTELFDEAAGMILHEMMSNGFVDEANGQVREFVALYEEELPPHLKNESIPGHIYGAAWFVLCEGELKNDDAIRLFGKKLLDHAMPAGFENTTTLIPTHLDLSKSVQDNLAVDQFIDWPQEEAVIAYRVAYSIFGEERYLALSKRIEETAFSYFADREARRWYNYVSRADGTVRERKKKGPHIAGTFHLERMLLALNILEKTGSILPYLA